MQELKVTYLPTAELLPYARNARTHSEAQVAQIAASIKEFGFNAPVAIDADKMILCGHGRVMAAQKLGMETVPTVCLSHLTPTQKKAYILADNKLALNAGWDEDVLKIELEELELEDFDLELTGFDEDEIEKLLRDPEDGAEEDDFDGEPPEDPVSVPGDVWTLGEHRLICGDATKIEVIEKLLDGRKADLLMTDPPYNVDYEGKTKDKLKIQNDVFASGDDFRQFLRDAFTAADAVMKPGAVFYICHADSEGYNFRGACVDVGWWVRQCLIWCKNTMVMGRQDYQWRHEPILYGWKAGASHLWASDRKQTTILQFDKPQRSKEHPTMKPVALFDYMIRNNTKGGDIVLDLFGGSGTTIMACEQNKRVACVSELDPRYADVIVQRWQEYTGKQAVRQDGVSYNDAKKAKEAEDAGQES